MPSILSRILGKKKNPDPAPLLDGEKYEAVPKTPSPSAPAFAETAQRPKSPLKVRSRESEKAHGLGIRRKPASTDGPAKPQISAAPILSLSLPDPKFEEKKTQGLGVVFEGITDGPPRLDDEVLGSKRLTPAETLSLVQKTSEVISDRGLDALGVMRPHWFASPRQQEIQLKLISRFLQTLSQQSNGASTSSRVTFESELRYTSDPHDVAAVLRWGLRHLQLEGNNFGSSNHLDWYKSFVESERSGSYPPKAFDDSLVPLLPTSHTQLLRAVLDLVSSLAAHSEENGISGNKLSKVLGWWVVSSRSIEGASWREFYLQWEAAARQFEHLFLAYIRTQEAQSRMPRRLTELVKNYPFARNRREDDGVFLPRSRFTTRSATALFVRVTVDKSRALVRPHPLRIVEDALMASAESESTSEFAIFWQGIRNLASKPVASEDDSKEKSENSNASLNLSTILTDETIRLLSLVPTPDGDGGVVSLLTSLPSGLEQRSISLGDRSPTTENGITQIPPKDNLPNDKAAAPSSVSNRETEMNTDWQSFSNAGFRSPSGLSLAASLWDNDTEVTHPVAKKNLAVGKRNLSIKTGSSRPVSVDSPLQPPPVAQPRRLTFGEPQLVKLDEAFIDFWADTLLDTIARAWPTFVVCQLKSVPTLRLEENDKTIEWLIIERVAAEPTRPSPSPVGQSVKTLPPRPNSPSKSESGKSSRWTTSTLAATRKRWSLFPTRHESAPAVQGGKDRAARKAATDAKVGEMGEILKEEDEGKVNGIKANGVKANGMKAEVGEKDKVSYLPATHSNGALKGEEPATDVPVESTPIPTEVPSIVVEGLPKQPEQSAEVAAPTILQLESDTPAPESHPVDTPVVKELQPAAREGIAEPQPTEQETHKLPASDTNATPSVAHKPPLIVEPAAQAETTQSTHPTEETLTETEAVPIPEPQVSTLRSDEELASVHVEEHHTGERPATEVFLGSAVHETVEKLAISELVEESAILGSVEEPAIPQPAVQFAFPEPAEEPAVPEPIVEPTTVVPGQTEEKHIPEVSELVAHDAVEELAEESISQPENHVAEVSAPELTAVPLHDDSFSKSDVAEIPEGHAPETVPDAAPVHHEEPTTPSATANTEPNVDAEG
ncbi:hypothetical protein K439DRAFT_1626783 [Ramaria rubella]|nr:hypothetical protein K439DRAFT_1626783 [Ramaria rubella]